MLGAIHMGYKDQVVMSLSLLVTVLLFLYYYCKDPPRVLILDDSLVCLPNTIADGLFGKGAVDKGVESQQSCQDIDATFYCKPLNFTDYDLPFYGFEFSNSCKLTQAARCSVYGTNSNLQRY